MGGERDRFFTATLADWSLRYAVALHMGVGGGGLDVHEDTARLARLSRLSARRLSSISLGHNRSRFAWLLTIWSRTMKSNL
jgi:hypothetical protein